MKVLIHVSAIFEVDTPWPEQGVERAMEAMRRAQLVAEIDKWDAGTKVCERRQDRIIEPVSDSARLI